MKAIAVRGFAASLNSSALQMLMLAGLVACSLIVNLHFSIRGFGEQDTARLVNDALVLHHTGRIVDESGNYRLRILPLSIHALKSLLALGIRPSALAQLLNQANAVLGALILIPLYFLGRRLASPQVSFTALILFSFMPVFWLARIYGYPHLAALFFFTVSLALFVRALDLDRARFRVLLALSAVSIAVATGIKADVMLAGGAFLVAALIRPGGFTRRYVVAVSIIYLVAIASPFVLKALLLDVPQPTGGVAGFVSSWSARFPLSRWALTSGDNVEINLRAFGFLFAMTALVAAGYLLSNAAGRRLLFFVACWSLPVVLFWGARPGNSARHLLSVAFPVALLIALFVIAVLRSPTQRAAALSALVVLNYFSGPLPSSSTIAPSTELISSRDMLQSETDRLMAVGSEFATSSEAKKLLVGSWTSPYVMFQVLSGARAMKYDDGLLVTAEDGSTSRISWADATTRRQAEAASLNGRKQGYWVWSAEHDLH